MYQRVRRYFKTATLVAILTIVQIFAFSRLESQSIDIDMRDGIPLGAWYRWLENTRPSHPNSHYRLEIYSFFVQDGGAKPVVKAVNAAIYPSADIRTSLKIGTIRPMDDSDGDNTKFRFDQDYSALAVNTGKAEGFPVATQFNVSGLRREKSQLLVNIAPGSSKNTVKINGSEFRSYVDDLIAFSQGPQTQAAARDLLRLLFAHIYLIEARIPQFGGNSMMNIKQSVPALVSGSLWVEFVAKGIFGFGNSGVLFKVPEANEFPRLWVKGEVFGGAFKMDGRLSFFVKDGGASTQIASFDASGVEVLNGITTAGSFEVIFPRTSYGASIVPVSHSVIGQ